MASMKHVLTALKVFAGSAGLCLICLSPASFSVQPGSYQGGSRLIRLAQSRGTASTGSARGFVRRGREGSASPEEQKAGAARDGQTRIGGAGVCATCHINIVLEWGVSAHSTKGVSCIECHGPSAEHVANEKNEVPPGRLPRGEQIAPFCRSCHSAGCPKTAARASCKGCHHVHALVDPRKE